MEFKEEVFSDIVDELHPLFKYQYETVFDYPGIIPFKPDYSVYKKLEDLGMLATVIARSDGKIVGYYVAVIMPHVHYSGTLISSADRFYIDPDLRGQGLGRNLIKTTSEVLKARGVKLMVLGVKLDNDPETMLTKLGFKPVEKHYALILE